MLDDANDLAHKSLSNDFFEDIVNLIPDDWLIWNHTEESPKQIREVYLNFLINRLKYSANFLNSAKDARG